MRFVRVIFVSICMVVPIVLLSHRTSANILRPVVQQPPLGRIEGILNHPDGKQVITWDNHQIISFWDPQSGKILKSWKGSLRDINNIAVSPDGRYLVLFDSIVGKMFIWDVDRLHLVKSGQLDLLDVKDEVGQAKKRLAGKAFRDRNIFDMIKAEFSPMWLNVSFDGEGRYLFVKELAGISKERVAIIDFKKTVKYSHDFYHHVVDAKCRRQIAINPLTGTFFCLGWNAVSEWDIKSGERIREFKEQPEDINRIILTDDFRYLVVVSKDQSIKVWDLKTGKPTTLIHLKKENGYTDRKYVSSTVVSPDHNMIVACGYDSVLRAWDFDSGELKYETECSMSYQELLSITPDSKHIVKVRPSRKNSTEITNHLEVLETDTGNLLKKFEIQTGLLNHLELDKSGRYALIGGQHFQIWDLEQDREVKPPGEAPLALLAMAYDDAEDHIIASYSDHSIKTWDARDGSLQKTLNLTSANVSALAYHSGKALLAAGTENGEIILWHKPFLWKKARISGHDHKVTSIQISPRHNLLISAGSDEFIKLWDLNSGKLVKRIWAHQYVVKDDEKQGRFAETGVLAMKLQPQEDFIVSGGYDGKVKIWSLPEGNLLKILDYSYTNRDYSTFDVAISPDGTQIAAIGENSRLRAWMVDLEAYLGKIKTPDEMVISDFFESNFDPIYGNRVYYHPHTNELLAVYNSQAVVAFDLLSGEYGMPCRFQPHTVDMLLFPKNGKTMITGGKYAGILLNDYPDFNHSASIHAFRDGDFSINYQNRVRGDGNIQNHLSFANEAGVCPYPTCSRVFQTKEPLLPGFKSEEKGFKVPEIHLLKSESCALPDFETDNRGNRGNKDSGEKQLYTETEIARIQSRLNSCHSNKNKTGERIKDDLNRFTRQQQQVKHQEAIIVKDLQLRGKKEKINAELQKLVGSYKQNQLFLTLTENDLNTSRRDIKGWELAMLKTRIGQQHSMNVKKKIATPLHRLFDQNILDPNSARISNNQELFSKRFYYGGKSQLLTLRQLEKGFKPYRTPDRRYYAREDLRENYHNPYPTTGVESYLEKIQALTLNGEQYLLLSGEFGRHFRIDEPIPYRFTTAKGIRNFVLPLSNISVLGELQQKTEFNFQAPFRVRKARLFNQSKEGGETIRTHFLLIKPRANIVPIVYPLPDHNSILIHLKPHPSGPAKQASTTYVSPYLDKSRSNAFVVIGGDEASPFILIRPNLRQMQDFAHGIFFQEGAFDDFDEQFIEVKQISDKQFSVALKIKNLGLYFYKTKSQLSTQSLQRLEFDFKEKGSQGFHPLLVSAKKAVSPHLVLPVSPQAICIALQGDYDRDSVPPGCIKPRLEYDRTSTGNPVIRKSVVLESPNGDLPGDFPINEKNLGSESYAKLKSTLTRIIQTRQGDLDRQNSREQGKLQKLNEKMNSKLDELVAVESEIRNITPRVKRAQLVLSSLLPSTVEEVCYPHIPASDCLRFTHKFFNHRYRKKIREWSQHRFATLKTEVVSLKSFSEAEITRQVNKFKAKSGKEVEKATPGKSTAEDRAEDNRFSYQLKYLPDKVATYPFRQANRKKLLMVLSGKVLMIPNHSR